MLSNVVTKPRRCDGFKHGQRIPDRPLTAEELAALNDLHDLREHHEGSSADFARSLYLYARMNGRLTAKQLPYVLNLAERARRAAARHEQLRDRGITSGTVAVLPVAPAKGRAPDKAQRIGEVVPFRSRQQVIRETEKAWKVWDDGPRCA